MVPFQGMKKELEGGAAARRGGRNFGGPTPGLRPGPPPPPLPLLDGHENELIGETQLPEDDGKMKGGPGRGLGVMNKLPAVFSGESHTNFMQKFSELRQSEGPAVGGVDSFLSKGKELIFKKFGLGE